MQFYWKNVTIFSRKEVPDFFFFYLVWFWFGNLGSNGGVLIWSMLFNSGMVDGYSLAA